ncbi:lysoplasmalogenase [Brachybacterium sp. SW0106-09]|uniref:lysoplasmalogenase n=1 Tax=Brachybacterium sp. SW0106-09 TaxID=1704590 RepID=UPI000AB67D5E|nr:lysoplasmalogenase [Brachybacterium sp. SW0106-09]
MRGMRGGVGALARAALLALALVTAVHLGAQLRGGGPVAEVTQPLLMPLLLGALLAGTEPPRGRLVRLFALGLVLSWAGDTLPRFLDGQAQFLAMLTSFLLAQIVYALALWPLRGGSLLAARSPGRSAARSAGSRGAEGREARNRGDGTGRALAGRAAVLPYLGAAALIVGLCTPSAGVLLPALVVYAAAICAMAVLATGLGVRGGIGGAVFVVSDSLIALNTFDVLTLPAHEVWVMATYVAAQVLLVLGVLGCRERAGRRPRDGAGRHDAAISPHRDAQRP